MTSSWILPNNSVKEIIDISTGDKKIIKVNSDKRVTNALQLVEVKSSAKLT